MARGDSDSTRVCRRPIRRSCGVLQDMRGPRARRLTTVVLSSSVAALALVSAGACGEDRVPTAPKGAQSATATVSPTPTPTATPTPTPTPTPRDRKSTRLNSSHVEISYAVFCLKKKNKTQKRHTHQQ